MSRRLAAPGLGRRLTARAVSAFPCYLACLAAALASLHVKASLLSYVTIGRALGRIEVPELTRLDPTRSYLFSPVERLSFYRADLLWGFVLLPALFLIVIGALPLRYRLGASVGASFLAIAFLYVQMRGFWMVGQFPSWRLWYDAVRWGLRHRDDALRYVGGAATPKIAAALAVLVVVALLGRRLQTPAREGRAGLRRASLSVYAGVLGLTAVSWLGSVERTSYHRSAVEITVAALLTTSGAPGPGEDSVSPPEVLARWRELTHSPPRKDRPEYFGAARGYDVVLFVLETTPARCLDLTQETSGFPHLRSLQQRAWIGRKHLTTYPYTSLALFSLLTSWYPTDAQAFEQGGRRLTTGFLHSLGRSGYLTAAYLPFGVNAEDEQLHRAAGISHLVYGGAGTAVVGPESRGEEPGGGKIRRDRAALDRLKSDVARWIHEDRRYAVLFLPQIGHAPWPDISEGGGVTDRLARCRALVSLQDQWIGELQTVVEEGGRADRTVVVVTADHGVRTRLEDPAFEGGILDPYSFHVPFLLFSPGALPGPVSIPWVTSHVDLSPSVLDLVGVRAGRDYELGSPVWDERIEERVTFMWAREYLGADGFHRRGEYAMWRYLSDTVSSRTVFDFGGRLPTEGDAPARGSITGTLVEARRLQRRITRMASPGN